MHKLKAPGLSGLGAQGLKVQGLGGSSHRSKVLGLGFRFWVSVLGYGSRVSGLRFRVSGSAADIVACIPFIFSVFL